MTRILSLDDDPDMLKLIGVMLELAGYEHLRTTDSHDAVSILRQEQIDLFTQDVLRPDLNGFELYELLKSDETLRHIPVLFLSAGSRPEFAAECRATHGDDYLTKPFGPDELLAVVTALLRRHGKPIPTAEEREARYEQTRAKWQGELNLREETLDALYGRIRTFPSETGTSS